MGFFKKLWKKDAANPSNVKKSLGWGDGGWARKLDGKVTGKESRDNKENAARVERDAAQAAADKAAAEAAAQAAETARQQKIYQDNMLAMQRQAMDMQANNEADLGADTKGLVIAGGTADEVADTQLKRKRAGGGLSSQLGINV